MRFTTIRTLFIAAKIAQIINKGGVSKRFWIPHTNVVSIYAYSAVGVEAQMKAILAPMTIAAVGVVLSILGIYVVRTKEGAGMDQLLKSLGRGTNLSSILIAGATFGIMYLLGMDNWWQLSLSVVVGLVAGVIIGQATEYYTSHSYKPTQKLAESAQTGPATVIISGVGMVATAAAIASLDRRKHLVASDMVVLAGIAGSYGDSVAVGEVVEVVSERCMDLPERFRQSYQQRVFYTRLRRVASNTVHTMGVAAEGADIENMEGAALFAMSEVIGFRAVEVRAISNRVGESFDKWHLDDATAALAAELKIINDGE